MRRAGLLLALATILASSASPAAAHPSPAGCASNALELTIDSNRATVRPGDIITYSVSRANQGLGACDVTAKIDLRLPAADGTPTGTVVSLSPSTLFPAGTTSGPLPTTDYAVAVNPNVTQVTAQAVASGVLHDSPLDSPATAGRAIGTTTTQPRLGFTFNANPLSGFAPFTATYEFVVSNTSTTNVPMDPPVIQHTSCPAAYANGDDGDNVLENNENWRYTCTRNFPAPQSVSSSAVAHARSTVDNQNVLAPPAAPVTVNANRPPAATLTLSRSVSPATGPAPLTVTHSYTLTNDGSADARPVRDIVLNDRLCAPVTRASGDALLDRGDTWSYTCTQTLATPQTVSGTAVATGVDDLGFNIVSSSNLAAIEVTATGTNPAPTPVPSATPTPTPEPEPDATPTPSRRVNLATTSGRLARPCGKTATAQLKVGSRVIATKRIKLDSRCRYTVRFTNVTRSKLRGATRVSVTVRSGRRTATHRVAVPKR